MEWKESWYFFKEVQEQNSINEATLIHTMKGKGNTTLEEGKWRYYSHKRHKDQRKERKNVTLTNNMKTRCRYFSHKPYDERRKAKMNSLLLQATYKPEERKEI